MVEVKHGENKFYVGESENHFDALMTYVPSGNDRIIIDHTEVSDHLQGQGIGKKLVQAAVDYARENDKMILATCPFAKGILEKHSEYHDVFQK
ncbi:MULTISPECIES: GNAT family N-acetyltransferase [Staphylococcus]|nr:MULTISPECIES: GNAT family N-acetyltransferase [Staphylococcus]KFE42528.1 putative acetyltransferase [Staphylococcus agnetis]NJH64748.1 GNAT family N-acetyltransferase [Staphylococcus agnetis]NJH66758.1 GNAT family N-acetyltransferase [Staphylococcus agnetis]NJH78519.1 GNAT family N-acetyltransferase [Staphylococcus agnetis]NJH96586.1 GNAT family N-acetyltransferase [Staphylococcus agnetis]